MKRVLVTGAAGFIGRHALAPLAELGYEVHALTSRPVSAGRRFANWHQADLFDAEQVEALISRVRPTHLLHLAWVTRPPDYWSAPGNVTWVHASLGLLDTFQRNGGVRAVIAGTCAEYDWSHGLCREDTTPIAPATVYGRCKAALWLAADALGQSTQLAVAWGRVFHVYGPAEHRGRLVPSIVNALLDGAPASCFNAGSIRDYLFVEDVAAAFAALVDSAASGAFNLGSGCARRLGDVASAVARQLAQEHLLRLEGREHSAGVAVLIPDVRRFQDTFGWRPKTGLEDGIATTIAWWRRQRIESTQEGST